MLLGVRPPDLRDLIAVCPVFRAYFHTRFHTRFRAAFGLPALESALQLGLTLGLTLDLTLATGVGAWVVVPVTVKRATGPHPSMFIHTSLSPSMSQLSIS
jgi:hypothetical protein